MTLNQQFLTMISMILAGCYLGIILDTFRRFSFYWRERRVLSYFLEACFWLVQTLLLFYVLFRVNSGELRVYVFIACLLGFSFYQAVLATIYKRLLEQVIQLLIWLFRLINRIVIILIITPIKWIILMVSSLVLFILKLVFLPVKWCFQLIYRLLPSSIKKFFYKFAGIYSIIKNRCIKILKYIKLNRR